MDASDFAYSPGRKLFLGEYFAYFRLPGWRLSMSERANRSLVNLSLARSSVTSVRGSAISSLIKKQKPAEAGW